MTQAQTLAVNAYFRGRVWERYGGVLGATWIVCGSCSYYFFFDAAGKIEKVLVD